MSTTTATDVHVTCSDFCGLPISLTGEAGKAQHATDCGATEDDLKKLDAELAAKRIHAVRDADAAEAEELDEELPADTVPPAKMRCSCGDEFPDWVPLGVHQTGTGHVGMWQEPNDALDDDALREREESQTVDGQPARISHDKPKGQKIEKVDYSHLWRDPVILVGDVTELQRKIDDGEITLGGIAAGKACIGKATFTDQTDGSSVEVACPHKCFARTVRANECSLEHTHTETLEQVCLIHAVFSWGGEMPAAGKGPLFGEGA